MAVIGELKALETVVLSLVKKDLPQPQEKKFEKVELSTDKLDFLQKVKKEELQRIEEAEKRNLQPYEERKMEELATTLFLEKILSELTEQQKKEILENSLKGLKDIVSKSFTKGSVLVKLKQGSLELNTKDILLDALKENFDEIKGKLFKE